MNERSIFLPTFVIEAKKIKKPFFIFAPVKQKKRQILIHRLLYETMNFINCIFQKFWKRKLLKSITIIWPFKRIENYGIRDKGINAITQLFTKKCLHTERQIDTQLHIEKKKMQTITHVNKFLNNP